MAWVSCPSDATPDAGTPALINFDVSLRNCAVVKPQAPSEPTAIRILPSSVLGALDCASVLTLDVMLQGTTVYQWSSPTACAGLDAGDAPDAGDAGAPVDAGAVGDAGACCLTDVVTFSPEPNLGVDTSYQFTVSASIAVDGGSKVTESTTCFATSKPKTSVLAVCDPLGSGG